VTFAGAIVPDPQKLMGQGNLSLEIQNRPNKYLLVPIVARIGEWSPTAQPEPGDGRRK
jgi:hypothetical protein